MSHPRIFLGLRWEENRIFTFILYIGFGLLYTIDVESCFSGNEIWEGAYMLDLYELRQLVAFADFGTLSRVAEEFHVSTPSVTRSM